MVREVSKVQWATTGLTKPAVVTNQAITALISGAAINGIINVGFNTIGAPKINGSLMLKIDGIIDVLPNVFEYFDFPSNNVMASANVAPEPPI